MHVYEVRPRKDERGFDLISDALGWLTCIPICFVICPTHCDAPCQPKS